jgi:chromosome segregation ATPase
MSLIQEEKRLERDLDQLLENLRLSSNSTSRQDARIDKCYQWKDSLVQDLEEVRNRCLSEIKEEQDTQDRLTKEIQTIQDELGCLRGNSSDVIDPLKKQVAAVSLNISNIQVAIDLAENELKQALANRDRICAKRSQLRDQVADVARYPADKEVLEQDLHELSTNIAEIGDALNLENNEREENVNIYNEATRIRDKLNAKADNIKKDLDMLYEKQTKSSDIIQISRGRNGSEGFEGSLNDLESSHTSVFKDIELANIAVNDASTLLKQNQELIRDLTKEREMLEAKYAEKQALMSRIDETSDERQKENESMEKYIQEEFQKAEDHIETVAATLEDIKKKLSKFENEKQSLIGLIESKQERFDKKEDVMNDLREKEMEFRKQLKASEERIQNLAQNHKRVLERAESRIEHVLSIIKLYEDDWEDARKKQLYHTIRQEANILRALKKVEEFGYIQKQVYASPEKGRVSSYPSIEPTPMPVDENVQKILTDTALLEGCNYHLILQKLGNNIE